MRSARTGQRIFVREVTRTTRQQNLKYSSIKYANEVFCLITGALICLCQDCCCFCMQPYPEVQHVPSGQGYSQQQFVNGVQPIQQPLHQQLYPPQPYLTSQAQPPFSLTQQQSWPLNANEQYTHPANRVTTYGDLTRPMGISSLKEDSIVQQIRAVPQGYINPVFPEPQGRFYPQQATAPSAPALDMNPPPYEP
ncbi:uncharacterized protein LOC135213718 isoform X2 [Macrobrachium nipponense]|uniref:uncharacterized protein LOC135213718 isoform X2 n=1 Tax=Macrobrachium nipponense TaxID=159736 RepID=UPI0030C80917